jgi:hypothetical protein
MTKLEGMTNDQITNDLIAASSFGFCASFVIRHSGFRHSPRIFELVRRLEFPE